VIKDAENNFHNSGIKNRKILLLAIIIVLGGLLIPIGMLRAIAAFQPDSDGNNNSSPTVYNTEDEIAQVPLSVTTPTVHNGQGDIAQIPLSVTAPTVNPDFSITKIRKSQFLLTTGGIYFITVTNNTGAQVTGNIKVTDTLPPQLSPNSVTGGSYWNCSLNLPTNQAICNNVITTNINIGPLPTIYFAVGIASVAPKITNTAQISIAGDFNPADNVIKYPTTLDADLSVDKTVSRAQPYEGEIVTYTVFITNTGPNFAQNIVVSDTLPVSVTYVSHNVDLGTYDPVTGLWNVGNRSKGQGATLKILVEVKPGTATKSIVNKTKIYSQNLNDPNSSNNSDTVTIVPRPVVQKTDSRTTVSPGDTFTYTMPITNSSDTLAFPVIITDILGADYTFVSDNMQSVTGTRTNPSTNVYVWTLTNGLNPRAGLNFKIKVKVKSSNQISSPPKLDNKVQVSMFRDPPGRATVFSASDTNEIVAMSITKSVSPQQAGVNQNLNFTLQVKNSGSSDASSVVVVDSFPTYLDIVSVNTNQGTTSTSGRTVQINIGTLDAGDSVRITINTKVNSTATTNQTATNFATMTFNGNQTIQSNTVSPKVIGSQLPTTGFVKPETRPTAPFWLTLVLACLMGVLGLFLLGFALVMRKRNPVWAPWFASTAAILLVAAVIFTLFSPMFLKNISPAKPLQVAQEPAIPTPVSPSQPVTIVIPTEEIQFQEPYLPDPSQPVPETLPDFPIPIPTALPTTAPGEEPPDYSAVERIVIPALDLDTVVKYVPFDGFTWLIAGLHQEVAWMGDTSWPGLGGNTGLAGHITLSNGDDGPFRNLDQLEAGDQVVVYSENKKYIYQVRDKVVVNDSDFSVIEQTANPQLTMITCTNWDNLQRIFTQRLVVYSDLIKSEPLSQTSGDNSN